MNANLPRWKEECPPGANSDNIPAMPKTAYQFMVWWQEYCLDVYNFHCFWSGERLGTTASHSEMRRWLKNHSIEINGSKPGPDDPVEFPITSFVLFPNKAQSRITIV
jgi:hypothetical protein